MNIVYTTTLLLLSLFLTGCKPVKQSTAVPDPLLLLRDPVQRRSAGIKLISMQDSISAISLKVTPGPISLHPSAAGYLLDFPDAPSSFQTPDSFLYRDYSPGVIYSQTHMPRALDLQLRLLDTTERLIPLFPANYITDGYLLNLDRDKRWEALNHVAISVQDSLQMDALVLTPLDGKKDFLWALAYDARTWDFDMCYNPHGPDSLLRLYPRADGPDSAIVFQWDSHAKTFATAQTLPFPLRLLDIPNTHALENIPIPSHVAKYASPILEIGRTNILDYFSLTPLDWQSAPNAQQAALQLAQGMIDSSSHERDFVLRFAQGSANIPKHFLFEKQSRQLGEASEVEELVKSNNFDYDILWSEPTEEDRGINQIMQRLVIDTNQAYLLEAQDGFLLRRTELPRDLAVRMAHTAWWLDQIREAKRPPLYTEYKFKFTSFEDHEYTSNLRVQFGSWTWSSDNIPASHLTFKQIHLQQLWSRCSAMVLTYAMFQEICKQVQSRQIPSAPWHLDKALARQVLQHMNPEQDAEWMSVALQSLRIGGLDVQDSIFLEYLRLCHPYKSLRQIRDWPRSQQLFQTSLYNHTQNESFPHLLAQSMGTHNQRAVLYHQILYTDSSHILTFLQHALRETLPFYERAVYVCKLSQFHPNSVQQELDHSTQQDSLWRYAGHCLSETYYAQVNSTTLERWLHIFMQQLFDDRNPPLFAHLKHHPAFPTKRILVQLQASQDSLLRVKPDDDNSFMADIALKNVLLLRQELGDSSLIPQVDFLYHSQRAMLEDLHSVMHTVVFAFAKQGNPSALKLSREMIAENLASTDMDVDEQCIKAVWFLGLSEFIPKVALHSKYNLAAQQVLALFHETDPAVRARILETW